MNKNMPCGKYNLFVAALFIGKCERILPFENTINFTISSRHTEHMQSKFAIPTQNFRSKNNSIYNVVSRKIYCVKWTDKCRP